MFGLRNFRVGHTYSADSVVCVIRISDKQGIMDPT